MADEKATPRFQDNSYTAEKLDMSFNVEQWAREIPDLLLKETPWGSMVVWNLPGESIRGESSIPRPSDWHEHSILRTTPVKDKFEELKQNSDEFLKRHGYVREGGRYRCVSPSTEKIAVFCHHGFELA